MISIISIENFIQEFTRDNLTGINKCVGITGKLGWGTIIRKCKNRVEQLFKYTRTKVDNGDQTIVGAMAELLPEVPRKINLNNALNHRCKL